jgi:hypothetical protein
MAVEEEPKTAQAKMGVLAAAVQVVALLITVGLGTRLQLCRHKETMVEMVVAHQLSVAAVEVALL